MRALRQDPTTGDYSVLATGRSRRPLPLQARERLIVPAADCPFCPGHEHVTGSPITERHFDGGWSVRAVANRFPAVIVEAPEAEAGLGAHEVLVESPVHATPLWEQSPRQMVDALWIARARLRDLTGDFRLKHISWFRQHGLGSGASQSHPHAQVIALPVVPHTIESMMARASTYHSEHGQRLLSALFAKARNGRRVLIDDGPIAAWCPWAPQAPFEVWLAPSTPGVHFRDVDDGTLEALAGALRGITAAVAHELNDPPHQVLLFTAPQEAPASAAFTWHMRIRPRLEVSGGFREISGSSIVSVAPEEAAEILRGRLGV